MKTLSVLLLLALIPLQLTAETNETRFTVENTNALQELVLSPDLWTLTRDGFPRKAAGIGLYWVSEGKDSARSDAIGLMFLNQSVVELLVRFGSNTVSEVMLSLFNRGDAGDIAEEDFQKKVTAIEAALNNLTGARSRDTTPRDANSYERKMRTVVWDKAANAYRLDYAYSWIRKEKNVGRRFIRPEYLNLTIVKNAGQAVRELTGPERVEVGYYALKKRVKKNPQGDVFIDQVPMVDQGRKGYCAVATTERVMRYYGVEVNQHELAQKAETASGGGTDPDSLVKALRSMANALRLQVHVLDMFGFNDLKKLVQDYDRMAKREKTEEIILPTSGVIEIDKIYKDMDKDLFLKARGRNPMQTESFARTIRSKIDDGYPVMWGVVLGFVEEKPELPQERGGHQRLIIGYNTKSNEVLYSDSWGAGHELKRMSLSNAYAISTALFTIEPR
jgi:hypothetical protein